MLNFFVAYILALSFPATAKLSFDANGSGCSFDRFMTTFVRSEKGSPKINTFLVAEGIEHPDGEYWVYWPQKSELILVEWPVKDCRSVGVLIRRRLDLKKDIVKSSSEVGTSTYLQTEDWAMKAIFDASRKGYQISVLK